MNSDIYTADLKLGASLEAASKIASSIDKNLFNGDIAIALNFRPDNSLLNGEQFNGIFQKLNFIKPLTTYGNRQTVGEYSGVIVRLYGNNSQKKLIVIYSKSFSNIRDLRSSITCPINLDASLFTNVVINIILKKDSFSGSIYD